MGAGLEAAIKAAASAVPWCFSLAIGNARKGLICRCVMVLRGCVLCVFGHNRRKAARASGGEAANLPVPRHQSALL